MGQAHSGIQKPTSSPAQLSHELAVKFSRKCFTPLELYSFQDVFKGLADHTGEVTYLKEETIARFLELPDGLEASAVLHSMISDLAAFPFMQDAPAVLDFEHLLIVVVILTGRYKRVLKNGNQDRTKLLFRALAVYDRRQSQIGTEKPAMQQENAPGFAIDAAVDERRESDEDDELAFSALESLDAHDVFRHGDLPIAQSTIPSDNLHKLIMLLILVATLLPRESLSIHANRTAGEKFDGLRTAANNVLAAFVDVEKSPGVKLHSFITAVSISLPFLFDGFAPLFERFLFSEAIDFSKRKDHPYGGKTAVSASVPLIIDQPILQEEGEILDINVLSQLSFFMPGESLFRRLRRLYSGSDDGYSMGSFETHVFNWRAPTILLISGSRVDDPPTNGQERVWSDRLPSKRFPDSDQSKRLVYGMYLSKPWQQTYKDCIGDSGTLLFQLEPVHEVFHASTVNFDYVYFTRPPIAQSGIGIGCQHPKAKPTSGLGASISLGPVSLVLDSSMEFGVFTHNYSSGGGAFRTSQMRKRDWQDRFSIESVEVWGCGGDKEAKAQRERWEWEEREAEARRRINVGKGDIEADRALLEMAGIIGSHSGGSMG